MAGLTINRMLELRQEIPELSDSAFLLFCFILHRTMGSQIMQGDKKVIYLTGNNDPCKAFGWNDRSYRRYKKELADLHLIEIKRSRPGKPAKVILTWSKYASSRQDKNVLSRQDKNVLQDRTDLSYKSGQICPIRQDKFVLSTDKEQLKDTTKRDNLKQTAAAKSQKAAPSSSSANPFKTLLEDGSQRPREAANVLEVLSYLSGAYPYAKFPDPKGTAQAWYDSFKKYERQDLMAAVTEIKETKDFFPSIKEFKSVVRKIREYRLLNEGGST